MKIKYWIAVLACCASYTSAADFPEGYWTGDEAQTVLDVTLRVDLAPDLSHISDAEQNALDELLLAGQVLHDLYVDQLNEGALAAREVLREIHASGIDTNRTEKLLDIFYLSKGPTATTLDNRRINIVPAAAERAGKNVYPADVSREEMDAYIAAMPERAAGLMAERSVVRRQTEARIATDIDRLNRHPGVEALHPDLRPALESLQTDESGYYAVPYALAYAPQLAIARAHLNNAAAYIEEETPDFAAYLRNRSRDLLSGDYESGDASWVTGSFDNLNAQIGSYETYNDSLYGVKAFYSASILVRDAEKSHALEEAISELQLIENSLPYDRHRKVRTQIPIGVYNIVADFGQARGSNTATILPNDADHTRKYGRTILLRNNIMTNPAIFEIKKSRFDTVIDTEYRNHLTIEGGFNRTLWHEIGHYLGVAVTADGRSLDVALGDVSDLLEEMKSDLVSLYAARSLHASGYYDDEGLRGHYADGIRRTLQVVKPRPTQPYQNMQLMQFNFYLEHGLIGPDANSSLLTINYDRYHEVVDELLREVLHIQYAGDHEAAAAFVERWNYWDEKIHGELATRMQQGARYRRTLVRYDALQ